MAAIKPTNPERQRSIPLVPPPRALYQYEPLPVTIPSFRLLRILPGLDDGLIKCELVIREFPLKSAERRQVGLSDDSDHICYNALSYEWGRVPGYSWILLNDGCINVGQNLSDFLHTAHEHMVCRSDSTFADFLWIDALCINQEDIQEKQHQIKRMSRLYQCAQHVFVWLGSHVGKAVHSGAAELRTLGDHFVELYEEPHKTTKT